MVTITHDVNLEMDVGLGCRIFIKIRANAGSDLTELSERLQIISRDDAFFTVIPVWRYYTEKYGHRFQCTIKSAWYNPLRFIYTIALWVVENHFKRVGLEEYARAHKLEQI